MESLTERQQQILGFIQRTTQEKGFPPSIREIGKHFGISSPNAIHAHLTALRKKGHLEASGAVHRGFRLANHRSSNNIPLLGQVRAGMPILADENIESYLSVDREIAHGGKLFALKVVGDSMSGAGIFEGDKVIVRQQQTAENGDIVVALKDDEATIKYLRSSRGETYLKPANPKYASIPAQDFSIIGKAVGLVRKIRD